MQVVRKVIACRVSLEPWVWGGIIMQGVVRTIIACRVSEGQLPGAQQRLRSVSWG
jgi:hypothetical protein